MQLHCGTFLLLIPVAISGNYLNCSGVKAIVENLQEVVVKIFEDFYNLTPVVNFVKSIEDEKIEKIVDEIIKRIMKSSGESMTFKLQKFDRMTKGRRRKNEFCVLFVNSYEGFKKIFDRMTFGEFKNYIKKVLGDLQQY